MVRAEAIDRATPVGVDQPAHELAGIAGDDVLLTTRVPAAIGWQSGTGPTSARDVLRAAAPLRDLAVRESPGEKPAYELAIRVTAPHERMFVWRSDGAWEAERRAGDPGIEPGAAVLEPQCYRYTSPPGG